MNFNRAIDLFIGDRKAEGRINSRSTERSYYSILSRHSEDIDNRDPRNVGRGDVKRTLRRWPNPNSQRIGRAILVSFYDWCMETDEVCHRADNPARQTPRPRKRPTTVYRLNREEVAAMLLVCRTIRERRAIHVGIYAGLRNAELRGLQGRHFERDGFVYVSADIAKGGREHWVPVIAGLVPTIDEIRANVGRDEYVLPSQRWADPPFNTRRRDLVDQPSSSQALRTLVMDVAKRAGVQAHIHPHLMRHAFGDHLARFAGIKNAQSLLGHASLSSTEIYVGTPSLDELAVAVAGFAFDVPTDRTQTPSAPHAQSPSPSSGVASPGAEVSGRQLVVPPFRPNTADLPIPKHWEPVLSRCVELYVERFQGESG